MCEDCGKAEPEVFLEVDHVDPRQKRGEVKRMWSRRWDVLEVELDKCVLRCHRDHADRTETQRRRRKYGDAAQDTDDGREDAPF